MRVFLTTSIFALVLSGCSPAGEQTSAAADTTPMSAEPSTMAASEGGRSRTEVGLSPGSTKRTVLSATMPTALRGQWRQNDMGRDLTEDDCDPFSQSNNNMGKVLTVTSAGYSVFEEGGRILEVHSRTDEAIEATFDTTYADTPTRARRHFVLQSNERMVVRDGADGERPEVLEYLRCS